MRKCKGMAASLCLFALLLARPLAAAPEEEAQTGTAGADQLRAISDAIESIKNPAPWLSLGADLRVRQEIFENAINLDDSDKSDHRNFFRILARAWANLDLLPPQDDGGHNHLSLFFRLATEPRYSIKPHRTEWGEGVYDNLYLNWNRIMGAPVSVRIGRQDLMYGRGFVVLDGTPFDGSRSIYMDGAKATVHLDDLNLDVDLLAFDNEGRQHRLVPINKATMPRSDRKYFVNEFDSTLFGAYGIWRPQPRQEVHGYFLSKRESPIPGMEALGRRKVHTLGTAAMGALENGLDYYGEVAYQWGTEQDVNRQGYGLNSELGYTLADAPMTPRFHAAYQHLSGNSAGQSKTYKGWDPVFARWPQFSELFAYRAAAETRRPGHYTNLQRFTLGGRLKPPVPVLHETSVHADYSLLLANRHEHGKSGQYRGKYVRGHLIATSLRARFTERLSGHLWFEYFMPSNYYHSAADDAYFARWELAFVF